MIDTFAGSGGIDNPHVEHVEHVEHVDKYSLLFFRVCCVSWFAGGNSV